MTDKELIQALRCCTTFVPECNVCPIASLDECIDDMKSAAADRLEALLAEVEHLQNQLILRNNDLLEAKESMAALIGLNGAHRDLEQSLERKCAALEAQNERLKALVLNY